MNLIRLCLETESTSVSMAWLPYGGLRNQGGAVTQMQKRLVSCGKQLRRQVWS